jgi:hypothetical protein
VYALRNSEVFSPPLSTARVCEPERERGVDSESTF